MAPSLESVPRELRGQASAVSHWVPETDGKSEIITPKAGSRDNKALGGHWSLTHNGLKPLSLNQPGIHI